MFDRVESQSARLDRNIGAGAAKEGLQPGNELDKGERLRNVVVSACAEACDAVRECIPGAEEEYRRLEALGANGLADVPAVGVGQADVDDEEVGYVRLETLEQLVARTDSAGGEPFLTESLNEHRAELDIVSAISTEGLVMRRE